MDAYQDISAVAALDEPLRRRLYQYVCASEHSVGRDEASAAVDLPRKTAAFHLDKLVEAGLLTVHFARLTGRSGPGAGRPSKLYSRAEHPISIQLPERSYELAAQLLAQAVEDAESTGVSPQDSLNSRALEAGRVAGTAERKTGDGGLIEVLTRCGYEPRYDGDDIVMANCPFHSLAKQHTDLVCAMNLGLIEGILDGADHAARRARLVPDERYCCVRIGHRADS
ncbi:helix-turn-helix domain-containing protein [Gordonia defluvii]|jgi:predicted ArsR family transcriptional regulator|uniref:Helix-turn-helix domain-containing protein n=1 Tax=Gordonia defluvii TaxID=283718 RepID=A0ABP6LKQ6_9ACTN|nr:helix-turn-helix domain-containing protein [Gordonia sp. UBA5067]